MADKQMKYWLIYTAAVVLIVKLGQQGFMSIGGVDIEGALSTGTSRELWIVGIVGFLVVGFLFKKIFFDTK